MLAPFSDPLLKQDSHDCINQHVQEANSFAQNLTCTRHLSAGILASNRRGSHRDEQSGGGAPFMCRACQQGGRGACSEYSPAPGDVQMPRCKRCLAVLAIACSSALSSPSNHTCVVRQQTLSHTSVISLDKLHEECNHLEILC